MPFTLSEFKQVQLSDGNANGDNRAPKEGGADLEKAAQPAPADNKKDEQPQQHAPQKISINLKKALIAAVILLGLMALIALLMVTVVDYEDEESPVDKLAQSQR